MVIGRCYTFSQSFDQAWAHLRSAEEMAFEILPQAEETRTLRADIMHEIGMTIVQSGGDKEEGVRALEKALRILGHDGGHQVRRGVYILGVGNIRFSQGRYEDALNYYMRAEALLEGTDSYSNLSTALCNLGVCHICLSTLEVGETYIMRSLELRIKTGSYGEIAGSYYNLAALYERKGDIEKAYKTMLISCDYALVSQVRELKLKIIHELEALSNSLSVASSTLQQDSHFADAAEA